MSAAVSAHEPFGLKLLQAIARGDLEPPPMVKLLGFGVETIEEGRITFTAVPTGDHYNALGTVHGGFVATLCDTALGCAIHTTLDERTAYTTVDLNVSFVRAVTKDSGTLRCVAEILHSGKRIATAQAKVYDGSGRLVAHATTTCAIVAPQRI